MGSSALGPKRRLADVSFSAAVRGEATFRGLLTTSFGRPELALSPSMCCRRRYSQTAWAIAAITTAREARARRRETGKASGTCLAGKSLRLILGLRADVLDGNIEPQRVIRSRPKARGRANERN